MPIVTIYSRPGCGLCDEMKQDLAELRSEVAFELQEVNIDEDPALRERYHEHVPVLAVDGEEAFRYRFDRQRFLKIVQSAD